MAFFTRVSSVIVRLESSKKRFASVRDKDVVKQGNLLLPRGFNSGETAFGASFFEPQSPNVLRFSYKRGRLILPGL